MSFHDFKDFTTDDFLENDYFRKSILEPNSESSRFWQQFLLDFPHKREAFDEAKDLLLNVTAHFDKEIQQVSEEQAMASFRQLEAKMQKTAIPKQINRRQWIGWSTAACLLLALGIWSYILPQKQGPLVYSTGNGERITLSLPDDSEVQLNANSSLSFDPQQWKDNELREVWLEGEAFFKVEKKASGLKFLVHAGEVNVSVLGTQFNVRSRGEDAKVMLVEGKVELAVAEQTITMKPGELASYSKTQKAVELETVESEGVTAWKDGISVFNNTLSEVVKELEILYGVQFIIKNEQLKDRKIQLSAPNDSLEQVLETLELLYPEEIRIEEKDGQMIIF